MGIAIFRTKCSSKYIVTLDFLLSPSGEKSAPQKKKTLDTTFPSSLPNSPFLLWMHKVNKTPRGTLELTPLHYTFILRFI
jgi:hypothetical protein